jgi:tetrapyrrole methylase family protein/MazG family protein
MEQKKNSGLTGEFLDNYLAWREVHGYPPPEKDVNAHWKETVDERMKFYMKESERTEKIAQISETAAAFNRLYETIGVLRAPGGCPWDRDQTPLSMRRDLIEETFEAVDAITSDDSLHAAEELGDVLLNASLIAYMYEQQGDFSIASMLNELCNKLIRRHPHVFPDSDGQSCVTVPVRDPESVLNQWDRIKETVEGRGQRKTILDEVPAGFPPLMRAYKLQKKAAKRGFDWQNLELVIEKIQEEFGEVQEAADEVEAGSIKPFSAKSDAEKDSSFLHVEEELGDLLFAVVDYCRHFGVDPSVALSRTNKKFYDRFSYVEQKMKESDIPMDNNNLARMEGFWNEAKAFELKKNKVDNELRF